MSILKRMVCGCLLLPVILVATCTGKMAFDRASYILPGEVLRSSVASTKTLGSPRQVAEALDAYVQPRFEILRDKNFGAMRIVYRKHAGIVQLKVDTEQEKMLIANVNAANHDYAISLLHCAPKPEHSGFGKPNLQLLYFNQQQIAPAMDFRTSSSTYEIAKQQEMNWESIEKKAISALPQLIKGREQTAEDGEWKLLMRPVLALKPECLSCHKGATSGATLGVMVYAVRNTPGHATTGVSLR